MWLVESFDLVGLCLSISFVCSCLHVEYMLNTPVHKHSVVHHVSEAREQN